MFDELCKMAKDRMLPLFKIAFCNGGEIKEETFHIANTCNNIYSISKNFTATAIGILSDRNQIKMSDTIYRLLSPLYPELMDRADSIWKHVTVEHLLTHTAGHAGMYLDMDCDDIFSYTTGDFLEKAISEPFIADPGKHMAYSDSNYYLASRIVSAVTGRRLQDFLNEELFRPLKMQGWAWSCCPHGYAMGGTRLFIDVKDMVKLGMLYLDDGVYEGHRILSEKWVKYATSDLAWKNDCCSYGCGFWRNVRVAAYHCSGMYGQNIFIDPSKHEVYAWQAYAKNKETAVLLDALYKQALQN